MGQFTTKEQYVRTVFLGLAFMIMFTSFNSLQNMVSKLYEEYDYKNLGQTAILFLYGTFGLCTFFTSYVIKHFGYKTVMFWSSIGYAIFQATGLLIVSDIGLNHAFVWIVVIIGAMICGASASALWVAQGSYISHVASEDKKGQLFSIFWGLMMSSQIFGNVLSTFILGKVNNLVYFICLTILGVLSALIFLFLPGVSKNQEEQKTTTSIKQQVKKVIKLLKNSKYISLFIYFVFPGITVAFYAGFLYKLIKVSVKKRQGQSDDDYNKNVSFYSGLVFIALGASNLFMGVLMSRISDKVCTFKLALIGTLVVQLAGFTSFIAYFLQSYPLCFICAFLWGCCDNYLQTNTNAMIAKVFPSNVQAYSVYRVFFALGVAITLGLTIVLSSAPDYIFLTIVLVAQCFTTAVSFNLVDLKTTSEEQIDKKSLVTSQQSETENQR